MGRGDYHGVDASASVRKAAKVRRVNELRGDRINPLANKTLSVPRAAIGGKARRGGHFALARPLLLSCSKTMG